MSEVHLVYRLSVASISLSLSNPHHGICFHWTFYTSLAEGPCFWLGSSALKRWQCGELSHSVPKGEDRVSSQEDSSLWWIPNGGLKSCAFAVLYPTIMPAEISFSLLVFLKLKPIHVLFVVGANCSVDFSYIVQLQQADWTGNIWPYLGSNNYDVIFLAAAFRRLISFVLV